MSVFRCANDRSGGVWRRCLIALAILVIPFSAFGETVKLPMTVSFALLRGLIVQQAYPGPGERAAIVVTNDGCNEMRLDSPHLSEENGEVRFQTNIHIVWGTPLGEQCLVPIRFSGTIVFWQQPKVDGDWRLRFVTRDSSIFKETGEKTAIPGFIWDLVKKNVHSYIDSIAIDLSPPVDNLKRFMLPQEKNPEYSSAERFLGSMRPEQPQVNKLGLTMNILADGEVPPIREEDEPGVLPVDDPEVQERILSLWRTWDALLVNMISQLSAKELTSEDHHLLLDILLVMRYEFSDRIGESGLTTKFIRRQFIISWLALRPLFERHLTPGQADSMLGYLSFFTAADALVVLDRIGPMLGIDIRREGLYRLAHMLTDQPLDETGAVNVRLRDMLGFGKPLEVPPAEVPDADVNSMDSAPVGDLPEETVPGEDEGEEQEQLPQNAEPVAPWSGEEPLDDPDAGVFNWLDWRRVFGPAEACAATNPQLDTVTAWTAELTPAGQLLSRVHKVLAKTAQGLEKQFDATVGEQGWGRRMLEATAWQESCFRQFTVKDKKITYLLSYNNTSVGVMQVNEKVWRGIYDLQELRWNAEYNILAGSEILALYLNKYIAGHKAFAQHGDKAGRRYLALWLYSLYNGGPGQLKEFLRRSTAGKLSRVDLSFQKKFKLVTDGNWMPKVDCLTRG